MGRKPLMICSILGTMACFLLIGTADSLWVLFAARFLDGVTGSNTAHAQACPPPQRGAAAAPSQRRG